MRISFAFCSLFLALILPGCRDTSLEVKGLLDRVIGETVTFRLTVGEQTFGETLTLRSAEGKTWSGKELAQKKIDDKALSFIIPTGIAAGEATATIEYADQSDAYEVPLNINRLALAQNDQGMLEIFPLFPATLDYQALSLISHRGLFALTPDGGAVATMDGKVLRLQTLGATLTDVAPGVKLTGERCLSAIPKGALITTGDSLVMVRFTQEGKTEQTAIPFAGCRAMATDREGKTAVVLHTCDTDNDTTPDADCVTEILFDEGLKLGRQVELTGSDGATVLDLSSDGKGAVASDSVSIYGVYFGNSPPRESKILWGFSAQPTHIDHTPAHVQGFLLDLFAVADQKSGRMQLVGFNPAASYELQKAAEISLPENLCCLTFGWQSQLYYAVGHDLYRKDILVEQDPGEALEIQTKSPIISLSVQR